MKKNRERKRMFIRYQLDFFFLFKKQWINKEYWEEMSDDERPDRERKCCLMGVTFITSSRKG